jgi:EAL and modified HD-GYP domain-containing signal transduction protein
VSERDAVTATQRRSFVGRQPIFDRKRRVAAYELLFRNSEKNFAEIEDPDRACADTLLGSVADIGLDALIGAARGYVNVSEGVLLGPHLEGLPKERITLEILETVRPTPEVLGRIEALSRLGFEIALDDFVVSEQSAPFLDLADVVKLDVLALPTDEVERQVERLSNRGLRLIAEKVETEAVFQKMVSLGFSLFQGYFFCRPTIVQGAKLSPSRARTLGLLSMLQDPKTDLRKIGAVVRGDPALTYRLLRYVNSSLFQRPRPVNTVEGVVSLLGLDALRSLVSLLVLSTNSEAATEVLHIAAKRARMCELLAEKRGAAADLAFTTGLLSLLDVLLGTTMEDALSQLPLLGDVGPALLERGGPLGQILADVEAYERAIEDKEPISAEMIDLHFESLRWTQASITAVAA